MLAKLSPTGKARSRILQRREIATFVDDRTLIVSASISEYDAHYIEKGKEGSATLATGEIVTGLVRYMAPVADEATGSPDGGGRGHGACQSR